MKKEQEELTYHVPVLLKESVDGMNIRPGGTYRSEEHTSELQSRE